VLSHVLILDVTCPDLKCDLSCGEASLSALLPSWLLTTGASESLFLIERFRAAPSIGVSISVSHLPKRLAELFSVIGDAADVAVFVGIFRLTNGILGAALKSLC